MQTSGKTQETTGYYPIFLNLEGRKCLVVGGGGVGTRKALMLNRCGADVQVVAPRISEALKATDIPVHERPYDPRDLEGIFLVFAATGDAGINRAVTADAAQRQILCNSADDPGAGDFILPAVVRRGDLICAVSTSGASPALAKKVRRDLESLFGPEYEPFLILMAQIRTRLLAQGHDPDGHREIFRKLVHMDLPDLIANGDIAAIDAVLEDLLGPDYSYRNLMSQES